MFNYSIFIRHDDGDRELWHRCDEIQEALDHFHQAESEFEDAWIIDNQRRKTIYSIERSKYSHILLKF